MPVHKRQVITFFTYFVQKIYSQVRGFNAYFLLFELLNMFLFFLLCSFPQAAAAAQAGASVIQIFVGRIRVTFPFN